MKDNQERRERDKVNCYNLNLRLQKLEKKRIAEKGGVCVAVLSPNGKYLISQQTGKRINESDFKTIIVCDIPRNSG